MLEIYLLFCSLAPRDAISFSCLFQEPINQSINHAVLAHVAVKRSIIQVYDTVAASCVATTHTIEGNQKYEH